MCLTFIVVIFPAGFAAMPRRLIWIFGLLIGVAWMAEILFGNLGDIPLLAAFRMSHLHGPGTMVFCQWRCGVHSTRWFSRESSSGRLSGSSFRDGAARASPGRRVGTRCTSAIRIVSLRRFRVLSNGSSCGLGETSTGPTPQARLRSGQMLRVQELAEE
jgi:hypothetical protein